MDTHNVQMERDRAAAKEASDKLEDARAQLEEEHTRPALEVHKQLASARQEQARLPRQVVQLNKKPNRTMRPK